MSVQSIEIVELIQYLSQSRCNELTPTLPRPSVPPPKTPIERLRCVDQKSQLLKTPAYTGLKQEHFSQRVFLEYAVVSKAYPDSK